MAVAVKTENKKKVPKKPKKKIVTKSSTTEDVVIEKSNTFNYLLNMNENDSPKTITIIDEDPLDAYCVFGFVSNLIDISKKDVRSIVFSDGRREVKIVIYE